MVLPAPSKARQRKSRRTGNHNYLAWAIVAGLGVLAAVKVAGLGAQGREDHKVDAFYDEVQFVAQEIRKKAGVDYTRFGALANSETRLASLKMVPAELIVGGTAVTPWGGGMQAAGISVTQFQVDLRRAAATPPVPVEACVSVANRLSGSPGVADFQQIGGGSLGTGTITHAQAVAFCQSATGLVVTFN